MTMTRLMTLALAGAVALGLSACGGGSGPEDAVKDFTQAASAKDYAKVCEMLDPEFVAMAEEADDGSCEDAMKQTLEDEDADVAANPDKLEVGEAVISEDGETATVPTTYEGKKSEIKLVKVDDAWKITFGL